MVEVIFIISNLHGNIFSIAKHGGRLLTFWSLDDDVDVVKAVRLMVFAADNKLVDTIYLL